MKNSTMISALAIAVLTAGFAPSEVAAKPKKYKNIAKKVHKQYHKDVRYHYNHYHRPYHVRHDWDDDYDNESWGVYTTPTGGIGFHYSENSGSYGAPYGYYPGYYY